MLKILTQIWNTKPLRAKILFTLAALAIFRLVAHIPVPGANIEGISQVMERNQLLGVFSMLTGGGIERFSVVLMGISPYITASIVVQLLTVVIPKLEDLSKEGERGRATLNKYTRYLTIPLALIQSYGMIVLLNRSLGANVSVLTDSSLSNLLFTMLVVTTGTLFLMWLGEIITEKGIGNGISVLIFAGIVSGIPTILGPTLSLSTEDTSYLIPLIGIMIFTVLLTAIVVVVTEAQRQIPVTYAGHSFRSQSKTMSHIPLRVNQAGMIPIIFAVSIIALPGIIANFFQNAKTEWVKNFAVWLLNEFNQGGYLYMLLYFVLVVAFTFFYVNLTFNAEQVADNIQKRGGFIPGIRPGRQTAEYLSSVLNRITLLGSSFLGIVAVLPYIVQSVSSTLQASVPMLISGAGLIIIVGVVLEIVRQINAQLIMQDYDKLY
ncbi:MAG: preprotein translocase subunit SecY [Candidatus Gracilibacteria bacterium]|nr:preprotein translocase subunit SecY [Candidatus Gracilibacteria bacterium]